MATPAEMKGHAIKPINFAVPLSTAKNYSLAFKAQSSEVFMQVS